MLTIYHDRYSFLLILCKKNKKELTKLSQVMAHLHNLT